MPPPAGESMYGTFLAPLLVILPGDEAADTKKNTMEPAENMDKVEWGRGA